MSQNSPYQYVPCPKCGSTQVEKMSYTWWGGVVGPALLTHVKCNDCGNQYNGKNGTSNTMGIVIYYVVLFVILVVVYSMISR